MVENVGQQNKQGEEWLEKNVRLALDSPQAKSPHVCHTWKYS